VAFSQLNMIFTAALKKNSDFSRIYKKGRHYTSKYLILYVLREYPDKNALGVTASRKVGKSVRRNKLKRLVKENYRLMEGYILTGFAFVFVIRAQRDDMPDFYAIRRDMRSLLARAGAFDCDKWEISLQGD